MRVPFYDIKAQYAELAAELDQATLDVLRGGNYVMGPQHNALEAELAARQGCRFGIAVNSGTDALRILMDAVGIGAGDEVITTPFTFVASVETIVQTGARPVFVDIDPETFQIDPAKVESAITSRTKAILPIHLFGQMCDMEPILAIAQAHNLTVLEDAAQAIGSAHNGQPAGKFGAGAGFSFYVTKNLGAAGDGGLIVTDDEEIATACRSIRVHGMGRERYYYDHIGYTSRLDELQAAILRVKLTRLDAWNARRAQLAAIYNEVLPPAGIQTPVIAPGNETSWHQYCILTPRRDALQAALKEQGIDSMIYYPVPIHFHAPYRGFADGEGSFPVAERVSKEILSLPIHPHLAEEQVRHAAEQIALFAGAGVGV